MTREMKNSGIDWIGQIPADWRVENLQWNMTEIIEKNSPIKMTSVLSLTKEKGVIPYEDKGNQGNKSKESIEEYKIAYKDTIVANSMNILIGSVGISNYDGCVSPVYYVFKNNEKTDLRYLNYIFTTEQFQKQLRKYANGILEIRLRVSSENIMKQKVMFPDLSEQKKIADFLDEKVSEIDKMIEETKSSIENYKEYKQSVITEAVTKGLNKNVQMKDSGIDWIGEIPADWQLVKLKYITEQIGDGIHTTPEYDEDGEYYFLNGNSIGKDNLVFKETTDKLNQSEYEKYKKPLINNNTIMITLNGATYGKTSFYNNEKVLLGKSAGYITLIPSINKRFVRYYLQSNSAYKVMEVSLCGTTIQNLSLNTLRNFPTPLPNYEEQSNIVVYLDEKCAEFDNIISVKEALVSNLEEYKKSLIYEYVTGKKAVE